MLTDYNGTAINYDVIGNPLNWSNASSLTWNARELTKQTLSDGTTLNYTYNSSGIRTRKVYNDSANSTSYLHNYILDGTKILKETVTITAIGGGTSYDLHYVYDESGNVVVEYTYDAWGKVLTTTGSLASTVGKYNPFRYRGCYYDEETGWYYLQSRYYDPVVGRFLNADGIVGANGGIEGYNMFAYCNNSPSTKNRNLSSTFANNQSQKETYSSVKFNSSCVFVDSKRTFSIRYDVPLYNQNGYNLCWAFCQIMMEDYQQGIKISNAEATTKAIQLAIEYHGATGIDDKITWDRGGFPTNMGSYVDFDRIEELYIILLAFGPTYAFYCDADSGHVVIVNGVDLTAGLVYTNNLWGISGVQTFEAFLEGFAGMPDSMYLLFERMCIARKD